MPGERRHVERLGVGPVHRVTGAQEAAVLLLDGAAHGGSLPLLVAVSVLSVQGSAWRAPPLTGPLCHCRFVRPTGGARLGWHRAADPVRWLLPQRPRLRQHRTEAERSVPRLRCDAPGGGCVGSSGDRLRPAAERCSPRPRRSVMRPLACKESTKLDRPLRSIRQALLLCAATRASPSTSFAKRAAPLEKPKYCFVREVGTLRLRQMTRWDFDVRRRWH